MKKFYLLALAACGFLASQAQETMYLKDVQSKKTPYVIQKYWYNEDNLCDSIYLMMDDEYEATVGIVHDENGNAVTRYMYKLDADYNWLMYNLIVYEYNEDGQVISAKNYADYFGTGYMPAQSTLTYEYENGLLVKESIYYSTDTPNGDPNEMTEYEYDDNGLLQQEIIYAKDEETQTTGLSQTRVYSYDDQGRVSEIVTSVLSEAGSLFENQKDEYQYDEYGNLSTYISRLANVGWQPAKQTWYKYDTSVKASDVVYPVDPYFAGYSVKPNGVHILVYDSTMLEQDGSWGLDAVQEYHYAGWDEVKHPSGISQAASDEASEMSAFVLGGRLYVSGLAEGAAVMVYDVNGRLLLAGRYNPAGIPTYVFPAGVKIVKSGNFSAKFF